MQSVMDMQQGDSDEDESEEEVTKDKKQEAHQEAPAVP
jgi:hypothetical protein